ncbi:Glyoxalase/bleomycin resistance protein/dioxygenase [Candidatus Ruthia magnifica str. Cm (Calyptogena magnifica)]|uniref:Glyoxalase/bleomycin resistance protein/dioxygenase n=1 Tax=Ruthia magnifica subsp. Calyptogena magnifica TaxID=413404 RepID=A1AXM8_RUTMC|nr:VOC family protein [Candidatus Ruthturnera calyptogenae]ABL02685.1 Glyoxalase/bleomycin resistance protein/dioxygenase [Candidatus Ruthia magnifica str. Cm (Calyptogena magnifica)]
MKYLHTMIRATNLDKTLHFYCDVLGLIEVSRKNYPQEEFTLIFLAADEDVNYPNSTLIEITHNWNKEKYVEGRNFGHLAFRVKNIYGTCKQLMDAGVVINFPPKNGHMAFVRSPDNISIELLQEGDALEIQEPWVSMPTIGEW